MASKSEIIDAIEALAAHFRPPIMSVEVKAAWMQDWCADLAEFPVSAIAEGCRKWRQTGDKFPTSGKLVPLVRGSLPNPSAGVKPEEWRPLSDQEYAGLTIREKMRHQMILAAEAAKKAGPMWRNPEGAGIARPVDGRIPPEEMPDVYRHWKAIEASHLKEVTRLREYISRDERAA